MACWMRRIALLVAAALADRAPCAKRRDAPLDCPRATESEPEKFEAFVDLLRREGDGLVTNRPKEGCLWFHVMSQTWFLELLGRPIDRVLRLESLEADLKLLLRDLPLLDPRNQTLEPSLPPKQNTVEGNFDTRTLLRTSPRGVRNALLYLRQDYECLGYEVPVM